MPTVADITQANTRAELAAMFHGIGAELGVAAGDYSEEILKNQEVVLLYSIDRWSDHHDEAEYQKTVDRLSEYGHRSKIVRATFGETCERFEDGSLDFIYIDGYAHTGQEAGETLLNWWPKLKSGGIFSGHDYCKQYQRNMDMIDFFHEERGLYIHTTRGDKLSSWVTVKP